MGPINAAGAGTGIRTCCLGGAQAAGARIIPCCIALSIRVPIDNLLFPIGTALISPLTKGLSKFKLLPVVQYSIFKSIVKNHNCKKKNFREAFSVADFEASDYST